MNKEYENMVNPSTGRNLKGQFTKGHKVNKGRFGAREVTKQLRQFAGENKVTEASVKLLLDIVKGKNRNATVNDQIKAATALIKEFNISAEKDADKEIAESTTATMAEMLSVLKGDAE